ncbi:hypothetical protein NQ318_013555 [Aromia moschata]|uniref:Uncharacterized protein n=1 Tax=Aromia moschata TaxID=1265417 RepID=A0AAV8XZ41_9CUCU|nr:hypothetical protein NQ318_013555 [Aromia moschata]
MDNLEKLWCHSVTTDEKEYGKTISCSYAEDIACFITEKNYMCTYQHFKLHTSAASKRIEGNVERIPMD